MKTPRLNDADLAHILSHTEEVWGEIAGQRIFLTGGTGFFGKWLMESFAFANDRLALGAKLVVLTRDVESFARKSPHLVAVPGISFQTGDIRTFPFPEGEFTYVIHAATEASVTLNLEQPLLMADTVIDGTRRALEFAHAHGARRFLLTSSGAVYGRQPAEITHVPEDYAGAPDPLAPGAAYGEGKRCAEMLSAAYSRAYGFDAIIARCYAFIGPYLPLDTHFAAGNFLRDATRGEAIRIGGDGTPYRSYLYAADLAIWLWVLLIRGQTCRAYNVGSEEAVTIAELARMIADTCDDTSVEVAQKAVPGKSAERYVPSVRRAATELDLAALVPLRDAVERTAQWLRGEKVMGENHS